jgi:cold shock protein
MYRRSARRTFRGRVPKQEIKVTIGVVKSFNEEKGYGFIKPDDGDGDVFVHVRSVERSGVIKLVQGMRIGFDVAVDKRSGKNEAVDLRVL